MRRNEYLAGVLYSYKLLKADELIKKIFANINLKDNPDELYKVKIIEILSLLLGTFTGNQLYSIEVPYSQTEEDRDVLYRALSRHESSGFIEKVRLKNTDAGARHIYGLTEKGHERIVTYLKKRKALHDFSHRKLCLHEYALGLSLLSLYRAGFDFTFSTEVVKSNTGYGNDRGLNIEGSIRSDAVVYFDGGKCYIEQDMGTERIAKLGSKIRQYKNSDNVMMITFHKAVCGDVPEAYAVERLMELSKEYPDARMLLEMLDGKALKERAGVKELLSTLIALGRGNDTRSLMSVLINDREQYVDFSRIKKLDDFKNSRMKSLYEYVINSNEEYDLLMGGMKVYCSVSELLYSSSYFTSKGTGGNSDKLIKDVVGPENVLSISSEGTYLNGAYFKEWAACRTGKACVEYPEDDLGALVRAAESAYKFDKGDVLILAYKTDEFGKYLASVLGEKKQVYKNVFLVPFGGREIYTVRFGKLIQIGERN